MPKALRVKTRFEATEEVSKTARKIEKNTRKMNKTIQRGFRKSTKSALGFKTILKGILVAGVISRGFRFLGRGLADVTTGFIDFENTITEAAVKFTDIGPRAENFKEKLLEIEKAARKAGETTKFTAPQAGQALLIMAKGGFRSATAMGALRGQIDFAIASGEDFALSTKISTKLLGSFGLNVENIEQKIENLNLVNDTLATTVNSSTIGIEELFDAMKDIGPIARNLNTDIVDVAAMAGVLGNEAIDGTKAMTGMRSMFLNLAAPSREARSVLAGLGLTLDDGKGKAKTMTKFLFELKKATDKFSETDKIKIFRGIFQKTGATTALILADGAQKVADFNQKLKEQRGEVALVSRIMQTTLKGRIAELNSALTELGFKVLRPFQDDIKKTIISLTEFFRDVGKIGLIKALEKVSSTFKTISTQISDVIKSTKDFFGLMKEEEKPTGKPVKLSDVTSFRVPIPPTLGKKFATTPGGFFPKEFGKTTRRADTLDKIRTDAFLSFKKLNDRMAAFLIESSKGGNFEKNLSAIQASKEILGRPRVITEEERRKKAGSEIQFLSKFFKNVFGQQAQTTEQPDFQGQEQPEIKLNVTNVINAKDVQVDTKVEAPGTSGKIGSNKFD